MYENKFPKNSCHFGAHGMIHDSITMSFVFHFPTGIVLVRARHGGGRTRDVRNPSLPLPRIISFHLLTQTIKNDKTAKPTNRPDSA